MASGYMTKLSGYIYEGEMVNGAAAPVPNGTIMVQDATDPLKLVLPTADTTTKFVCKEVTTIYDQVGYRFVVDTLAKRYYFVENGMDDFNDGGEYDNQNYVTKVGALLRAHPLLVGEEFVSNAVTGTPAAGTAYGVKADGTVG